MKYKIATKGAFEDMAWEADRRKRNRRVTQKLLDAMDPNGINVLTMAMPHRDGAEVRGMWMVKLTDSDDPALVWLDMSWDNYNSLPGVDPDEIAQAVLHA